MLPIEHLLYLRHRIDLPCLELKDRVPNSSLMPCSVKMATASDLEAKGLVLDDKDRNTLRLKDENYAAHTWDNLKHTIGTASCFT